MNSVRIEQLSDAAAEIDGLSELLRSTVDAGASIGFLRGLTEADAIAYWRRIAGEVTAGSRAIWVARDPGNETVIGTVQLALATPPNGRHRAEVQKLLVHGKWRRQGIAQRLIAELEGAARQQGRTLLVLDTSAGPEGARAFYEAIGYRYAGGIPGFALEPGGTPTTNAIYYKQLAH